MRYNIAVFTHYYNSRNYGGLLQAYALVHYLNARGNNCEQIQYVQQDVKMNWKGRIRKGLKKYANDPMSLIKVAFTKIFDLLVRKVYKPFVKVVAFKMDFTRVENRANMVSAFRQRIPHNENIYGEAELEEVFKKRNKTMNKYDIFIAGSDQVWRDIKFKGFFLYFVPDGRKKISYAASISRNSLTEDEKTFFRGNLKDFAAISVREENAVGLLQDLCNIPVEWVLDPTLLLEKKDWDEICSKRIINERYVFCYFLGPDKKERKLAREYARKHKLKLVTLPFLTEQNYSCDFSFGRGPNEERLFEIGVEDFLSLIKYSDYVFTDSFHAVVFSGIYEREYVVFERKIKDSMGSRINSLISLYETSERYCNTLERQDVSYIDGVKKIDYSRKLDKLTDMKEKSKLFLDKALSK